MKTALKFLALGVAIAASATMAKADTLYYTITVNGDTATAKSGSSTTGDIAGKTVTVDGFSITFDAVGAPKVNAPNLSTNAFTIINNSNKANDASVEIEISDVGLMTGTTPVLNAFTTNSLSSTTFTTDTISNYYDTSNATYGEGSLLASVTFAGDKSFSSGPTAATITPTSSTSPYSETMIYTIDFGPSSNKGTNGPNVDGDSLAVSSQIVSATPEPSSLALLGTSLLGAAGLARRRFMSR